MQNGAGVSVMREANQDAWLNRSEVEFFEQTRVSRNERHAVTLLWTTIEETEDKDSDDATSPASPRLSANRRERGGQFLRDSSLIADLEPP